MARIQLPTRQAPSQLIPPQRNVPRARVPFQEIIQSLSQNPLAQGIGVAGDLLSKAIETRGQLIGQKRTEEKELVQRNTDFLRKEREGAAQRKAKFQENERERSFKRQQKQQDFESKKKLLQLKLGGNKNTLKQQKTNDLINLRKQLTGELEELRSFRSFQIPEAQKQAQIEQTQATLNSINAVLGERFKLEKSKIPPAVPQNFKTPEEVKSAVTSKRITLERGKSLLKSLFNFGD